MRAAKNLGRFIPLSAGSVVFTPKGVSHVHAADDDDEIEYVYFTKTGHNTIAMDAEDAEGRS